MKSYNYLILILLFSLVLTQVSALGSISFLSPTPANNTLAGKLYISTNNTVLSNEDSYSFIDIGRDVIGWWTFSKYSATQVFDERGGNNLTIANIGFTNSSAITTQKTLWGNSSFNMSNGAGYFIIPKEVILKNDFSLSMWVSHSATNPAAREVIFGSADPNHNNSWPYISWETSGGIRYRYNSENTQITPNDVADDNWHHIVMNWDTGGKFNKTTFWVDKVMIVSLYGGSSNGTFSGFNFTLGGGWNFGTGHAVNNSNAYIDDVMIFNRTLTIDEMASLYNSSTYQARREASADVVGGLNVVYTGYVVNKTGNFSSTETRTFTYTNLTTITSPMNYRTMINPLNITAKTNFVGSCQYSLNNGTTNTSMSEYGNNKFYASTSSTHGNKTLDVYCNDSITTVKDQSNFTIAQGVTYYVGKHTPLCSDYLEGDASKSSASNETTPFCNINRSLRIGLPADKIIIYPGIYCESIYIDSTTGSGNSTDLFTVEGLSNTQRPVLNGTCGDVPDNHGIRVGGISNLLFRFINISEFIKGASSDGIHIQPALGVNATNLRFVNLTVSYVGNQTTGSDGDGISYHSGASGESEGMVFINGNKTGIDDIDHANTNYTDIDIQNAKVWGIAFFNFFPEELHYLTNININNSGSCLYINDHTFIKNLKCNNSTTMIFFDGNSSIYGINVSNTRTSTTGISVQTGAGLNVFDGSLDKGVSISGASSFIELTNVSYPTESVASGVLTRKWHTGATSNKGGAVFNVSNTTSTIYYGGATTLNLTAYIRTSSTNVNQTYNITATLPGNSENYSRLNRVLSNETSFSFDFTSSPYGLLKIISPASGTNYSSSGVINGTTYFNVTFFNNTDAVDALSIINASAATFYVNISASGWLAIGNATQCVPFGGSALVHNVSCYGYFNTSRLDNGTLLSDGYYSVNATIFNTTGGADLRLHGLHIGNLTTIMIDNTEPRLAAFQGLTSGNNHSISTLGGNLTINISTDDALSNVSTVIFFIINKTGSLAGNATVTAVKEGNSNRWSASVNTTHLLDGVYNITAFVMDNAGNFNRTINGSVSAASNSYIKDIIIDNTPPVISHSCTPNSVEQGAVLTCTCTGSSAFSGINSTDFSVNPSTASSGIGQTTTCTVTDRAGNSASSLLSYDVIENEGGGGGGGSGGSAVSNSSNASTSNASSGSGSSGSGSSLGSGSSPGTSSGTSFGSGAGQGSESEGNTLGEGEMGRVNKIAAAIMILIILIIGIIIFYVRRKSMSPRESF